ncbi:MAG: hypothetical protein LBD23_13835 [Oscillospiraceae bacterium]|jgi:hypothetical protein|nr:hypothetical protein [Oscillospiraceae bacterium]
MSTHPVTLKSINEVALYQKNLIPASLPDTYALNPIIQSIANEENIRTGVVSFRDFLYVFCDRLISDGHIYAKPPKNPSSAADYPFLFNVTNLLVDIGYYGRLDECGNSLIVTNLPSCTATVDENGKKKSAKISGSALIECLRFLALCGFAFNGIDLDAKTISILETQELVVSYPNNSILLIGLKALAVADIELRKSRRYWNDNNLLRCDYRLLMTEEADMVDVLKDFLHPLPKDVQEFSINLHERYINKGLNCINTRLGLVSFAYVCLNKNQKTLSERDIYSKRIWEFSYSIRDGYSLVIRAKKIYKYADIIKGFPQALRDKIAVGYGCYRKLGRKFCQGDCQGIRIALDESILDLSNYIETWLDIELPSK